MNKLTLTAVLTATLGLLLTGCQEKDQSGRTAPPPGSSAPAPMEPPSAPIKVDVSSVKAALKAADPALEAVTVTIDDKAIKLTGTVADNQMKKKAYEAVKAMAGDKQVLPQLLVK